MKKLILFIIGFTPFLIGFGMNLMILNTNSNDLSLGIDTINLVFLIYWGVLGYFFSGFTRSKLYTLIIFNFPAFLALLLNLFQELINKQYWTNYLGIATQIFYMPTMRISFYILPGIISHMWQIYIVSFLLMIIVFYVGCVIKDKKKQNRIT